MSTPGPRSLPAGARARLEALVREDQDEECAREAVARGLVDAATVDELRAAGEPLLPAMRARGLLDDEAIRTLERAVAARAFARPSAARVPALPPEAAAAAADPANHVAELVLVDRIGAGGAGEVWRAWDRRHERWVAVKLGAATLDSPAAHERFDREIRAAARLSHPNIVPVYASGTDRGRPYIVMPMLHPAPRPERMPPRRAIELVRTAALALQYAHEHDVLHRDVKPDNIVVTADGHVFVLDFGLAFLREDAARVTRPGLVFGTAAYMAPEQTRGDALAPTPAADVYGLGATLYHFITGRPPFAGGSFAEIVARVTSEDPAPPRDIVPTLDRGLEAVIQKAMAREPRRRYASAADLAEDLRRLLEHEQIAARPDGVARRAWRSWRRHPGRAAVALAVASLTTVAVVRARQHAIERAATDAVLRATTVALETALRLRRAGDLAGMRMLVPEAAAAYDRARTVGVSSAELDHAMGRMFHAVLDPDRALEFEDRALARNPALSPALYERAVLLAERYGRLRARDLAWARGTEDLASLRARIVADCQRLATLPLGETQALAARGIFALHERDLERARALLTRVVARDPDREEAWLALASALESLFRFAEADSAYSEGIARDRGFIPLLIGRCGLRVRMNRTAPAIADAQAALDMDPTSREARVCRATAMLHEGNGELMRGLDPGDAFDRVEADFTAALASDPTLVSALWGRATVRRYRALGRARHGEDPLPALAEAEADYTRAVTFDPSAADCWTGRARARSQRAFHLIDTASGDPTADLRAAEDDFAHAERIAPKRADVHDWRGEMRARRALFALSRGGADAAADAQAAVDDLERVSRDRDPWVTMHRARALRARATVRGAGEDARADLRAAADLIERVVAALPGRPDPLAEQALILAHLARATVHGAGEDARADLRAAADLIARVVAALPGRPDPLAEQALILAHLARATPPGAARHETVAAAEAAARAALQIDARHRDARAALAVASGGGPG